MNTTKLQRLAKAVDRFEGTLRVELVPKHGPHWGVNFGVTADLCGVMSLEFIVWAVGELRQLRRQVFTTAVAPPPVLNGPGRCLTIWVKGARNEDPGEVAKQLDTLREELWSAPVDEPCRECGASPSLPMADDDGTACAICPDCFADPSVVI